MRARHLLLTALGLVAACGAAAGEELAADPLSAARRVEVGGLFQNVTHSYGDWRGVVLRAVLPLGPSDVWYADVADQEAFGDRGLHGVLAETHTWSDRWYTHASVGGGTGDFFFPRYRLDASVSRKWLESRRWVTTLGVTYVRAKDEHTDRGVTASSALYLGDRVVAEVGGRLNVSDPGAVRSGRGFGVLTVGREGSRLVTLRLEGGTEGYQQTETASAIVGFWSREVSLAWREWWGRGWGTFVEAVAYDNSSYTRAGATVGGFYAW